MRDKRVRIATLALALGIGSGIGGCSGEATPEAASQAPIPRFEQASADPLEHGERLSHVLGCIGCHNLDLTGNDWSEPDMGVLWVANLTRSAGRYSEEELTAMIVEGKRPDRALMDMPSYLFSEVHPQDIADLVAYLKSLEPIGAVHPEPTIGPELQRMIEAGEWRDSAQDAIDKAHDWPPDLGAAHALGRHIVRATCIECHGSDLRGDDSPLSDAPARPDLRMVAAYSPEDFATLMTTGKAAGGRELVLMSGVARHRYSRFTKGERDAVYGYLAELSRRDP